MTSNAAVVKWALAILVGLTFLFPSSVLAQDPECPGGYICIDEAEKDRYLRILQNQKCLNESLDQIEQSGSSDDFSLTHDPLNIIVTHDGQTFVKDKWISRLEWCSYDLELVQDPDVNIQMRRFGPDEKRWGWRLRVRLGVLFDPVGLGQGRGFQSSLEPALALEPFFYRKFHLSTHAGLRTFGLGAGMDITRNMDVYAGVATRWLEPTVVIPVIGLSLSIN